MDRIRVARAGLLIGWILVSMLVVAGFAAFTAEEDADSPASRDRASVGDLGRTAGAVSALAFAGTADSTSSTSTSLALDPEAAVTAATAGARAEAGESDKSGGVYVRSDFLEESDVRALVAEYFLAADVNRAIRVAWCESAFNPAAVNPASGASGLFQHLPEHWAERSEAAGHPGASLFDPEANVAVAAWMLYDLPGGWSHWECTR